MLGEKKFETLGADLRASVVVFFVALPLGMGIAIASGYPPMAGFLSGIIGGILVGALSGSPLQVSGCAAGLTVVTFHLVQEFGLAQSSGIILVAGLLQVAGGWAKIGRWFQAISPAVLHGMLAGIGVLIIASQSHVMFDGAGPGGGLANIEALLSRLASFWVGTEESGLPWAPFSCSLVCIVTMVVWPRVGGQLSLWIPAPLLGVILAALTATGWGAPVKFVHIPEDLSSYWQHGHLSFEHFNLLTLGAAVKVALIASAESLLCAGAVDQMHPGVRTNYNKELLAQGVGNIAAGLLGALPMTGVIVRSSANVLSGGLTRASTIFHGAWLLLALVFLPQQLALIPSAGLGGLLVYTGAKLVSFEKMRLLYRQGPGELLVFLVTMVAIVAYDLLFGVLLGLALAGIRLLAQVTSLSTRIESSSPAGKGLAESDDVVLTIEGVASFLRLPLLAETLHGIPPGKKVVLRSHGVRLVDHACQEHFSTWRERFERSGGQIVEEGTLFTQKDSK